MQAAFKKPVAAVFQVKLSTGCRLDMMDGAKEFRTAKVLKQKRAELLIFCGFAGQKVVPVVGIMDPFYRL